MGLNILKGLKKRKEKKESDISKIVIAIMFLIALFVFVIRVIIGWLHQDIQYDIENIDQYIMTEDNQKIDDKKLVTSYSRFHTIEDILEQYINELVSKNYAKTYDLLDSEMLNKYKSKKEYVAKIEEFTNSNFVIKSANDDYINKNKLKRVYSLSSGDYLAEYETIDGSIKKIGVRLYTKEKKYKIFYIEM